MTTDKSLPPAIAPKNKVPRPDARGDRVVHPTSPPPPPPSGSSTEPEDLDDATRIAASSSSPLDDATRTAQPSTSAPSSTSASSDDHDDATVVSAKDLETAITADPPERSSGTGTVVFSLDDAAGASAARNDGESSSPADTEAGAMARSGTTTKNGGGAASGSTAALGSAPATAPNGAAPAGTGPAQFAAAGLAGTAVTEEETKPAAAKVSSEGASAAQVAPADDGLPRRVRLSIVRIDPWSVLKLSLLLSFAIGIGFIVATAAGWYTLDGMQVFQKIQAFVKEVAGSESKVNIMQYVEFSRVIAAASIIAMINVVLMTAISTIGAFVYNVVARLVGGLHMSLMDE